MYEKFIIDIIIAIVLLLFGLMFLEGIWHKKGKLIKSLIDIDNLFFPNIKDFRIFKLGDQLASLMCFVLAFLSLVNGLVCLINSEFPNYSGIFVALAVLAVWPFRILYIFLIKRIDYEKVIPIWPYKKPI